MVLQKIVKQDLLSSISLWILNTCISILFIYSLVVIQINSICNARLDHVGKAKLEPPNLTMNLPTFG